MAQQHSHEHSHGGAPQGGTHSYFDWQVSTLMLAYDAVEPIDRNDEPALATREQAVQRELFELVRALLPDEYLKNPESDFPPDVVVVLTRGTIARAAQIMGMTQEGDDGEPHDDA